jgi:hypothetical protein
MQTLFVSNAYIHWLNVSVVIPKHTLTNSASPKEIFSNKLTSIYIYLSYVKEISYKKTLHFVLCENMILKSCTSDVFQWKEMGQHDAWTRQAAVYVLDSHWCLPKERV